MTEWKDGSGRSKLRGESSKRSNKSLATSVFVFHLSRGNVYKRLLPPSPSPSYFQGIIENRIFPRSIAILSKMDIVRIFNISRMDFSLHGFQAQTLGGLISQKYYHPFAQSSDRKYLCQEKKKTRTIRERCLVFQQNPLTASPSPSSHKFLLFSSRISPSFSLVLLNQTKTRQEGRDSHLFRGLDNSQPPCKKRSAKRFEEEQQGGGGPARMQITSEAVIPEVGRSVGRISELRSLQR